MKKLRQEQAAGWTKKELADYYRLEAYDIALPQQWLNDMADKMAKYTGYECYDLLRVGSVWHYPDGEIFGEPFYLDDSLETLVKCAGRKQDEN